MADLPDRTVQPPEYADDHCLAELRRALSRTTHPKPGRCGPDSTGCRTSHHLAAEEALNLLGRGDFALARRLLDEHDRRTER